MKMLLAISLAVVLALSLSIVPLPAQPAKADSGDIYFSDLTYPTIQSAINAAYEAGGGTVNVNAGTYSENITMRYGVIILGAGANVTTINGGDATSTVIGADNSTISGFTVTGSTNGIYNSSVSPTIVNNIITGNAGAGIQSRQSSSPTIVNNIITSNNWGIFNHSSSSTITNNTICGNAVGISTYFSPTPTIGNNIIAYNTVAGIYNRGHLKLGASHLTTSHNLIFGTGGSYQNYTEIGDAYVSRTSVNDIPGYPQPPPPSQPPQFVNAAQGNYHLQDSSPCIDAGSNGAVPGWLTTDFEGDSRIVAGKIYGNNVVDIGADEFVPQENTLEGSEVNVPFPQGVKVTFDEVTTSGNTTVSTDVTEPPENPSGFMLAGDYYDINTTATYGGNITVCLPYDLQIISGSEEELLLFHFNETSEEWEDVPTTVNIDDRLVCGEVSSLSIFGVFELGYTLAVQIDGSGSVVVNPEQLLYAHGTEVELTAEPDAGWSFAGWGGDLSGNENPETILMDSNKNATATFTAEAVSGARTTKRETVDKLEEVDTGNRKVDRTISKVIKNINKSLRGKYWNDDSHLIPKYGKKVFSYERKAVGYVESYTKHWQRRGPTPEQQQAISVFAEIIPELVEADQLLAEIALDEAHDTLPPENHKKLKRYQSALTKADKYFNKALSYMDKDRPSRAIKYFGKSWQYSQKAISLARQA